LYGCLKLMTSTRARLPGHGTPNFEKNKTKFEEFPLAPSITPRHIQNRMLRYVALGTCYNTMYVKLKSIRTFLRYTRPRNRTDFVKRGSCSWDCYQAAPERGLRYQSYSHARGYKTRHKIISIALSFAAP